MHLKQGDDQGQCEQFGKEQTLAQVRLSRQEEEETRIRVVGSGERGWHNLMCQSLLLCTACRKALPARCSDGGILDSPAYPEERLSQERFLTVS